ncbi:MAG: hypothetical protein ACPG7F_17930, partial [Aggregatilineales bacterium]
DTGYQLTDDGTSTRRYEWVTWSRNGQLAYFCCNLQFASDFETGAYVSTDGITPGEVILSGEGEPVIYAGWSPGLCLGGNNCDALAMLINDLNTGALRVDVASRVDDNFSVNTIATGNPFYFTWSPGGDRMVFHRMGRDIDFFDVSSTTIEDAVQQTSSGLFQSPAWSPVDDRVLFAIPGEESGRSNLVVNNGSDNVILREEIPGTLSFLWSPDGNYVAYRVLSDGQYGRIFIVDAITGETIAESNLDGTLGFFWSPDSNRLAYLTVSASEGNFNASTESEGILISQTIQEPTGLSWNVLDVQANTNQVYPSFIPTREMIYLLTYFDQFAPSHRLWSPDSSHLVYSEVIGTGDDVETVITILDVIAANSVPLTIGHGSFAVWSYE